MLNPLLLGNILQWTMSILSAAPQVADLYTKAKDMISVLFTAGLITIDQQRAIHAHIDSVQLMVEAGIIPPSWLVDPDPITSIAAPAAPVAPPVAVTIVQPASSPVPVAEHPIP